MNRLLERMSAYLQEWEERLDAEKYTLPPIPAQERQSPPSPSPAAPASRPDLTRSTPTELPAPTPTPVPATAIGNEQTDSLITDNLAAHKHEPGMSARAQSETPGSTPLAPPAQTPSNPEPPRTAAPESGKTEAPRTAAIAAPTPGGAETDAAPRSPAAKPGTERITLHEFLWRKVRIEYSHSGYPEADLRLEFDRIVQAWLDCGKLTGQDGEIRLNRQRDQN